MSAPIIVPAKRLTRQDLVQFRDNPFAELIKFVADIRENRVALGGEMHADAERELLESGSRQEDIWGANLYPWGTTPLIEYTSLINIRPSMGNRGMEIKSADLRARVDEVLKTWVELS